LRNIASYADVVRPHLSARAFEPARSRLLWLPVHMSIIALLAWSITLHRLTPPLWPVASLVIGVSMSAIAFLGHEVLHGAIVRGRVAIRALGGICLLPFTVSPTLWTNWHNRIHHHHCAKVGADPDMYPTLDEYRSQFFARIMADYFGLGGRRYRSWIGLLVGFTGQSQQMLWEARRLGILTPALHRRALVEFMLGVAWWAAIALIVGGVPFVFIYVLPLVVANVVVMMFILTNHSLSSLTPTVNDPLVNSLSVTLPRALEWLSLDFGFHVEHHIFPSMSARHGREVRDALRAHFGERYQSMPITTAARQLYRTGRVYFDDTTLIDPRTGQTSQALPPRVRDEGATGRPGWQNRPPDSRAARW
jgi:fatty acid desaturase